MFVRMALAAGVSLLASTAALAQDASPNGAKAADDAGVEEILVTAQRRTESLTSVPLSIAAIGGETLQATGIQTISDLRFSTPGYATSTQAGITQIYIRGIGNAVYVGADPSVATFIDDVPRVYATLADNLINIDRVEILKGAQGGLYGRNATGGVVNIITRQPGDELAMQARVSVGSHNTLEASGYVNVPLGDRVALNVSGMRKYRDPYIQNLTQFNPYPATSPGNIAANAVIEKPRLSDEDLWYADGKLRFQLTDDLKITLAGDYTRKRDGNGNGLVPYNPEILYNTYAALAPLFGVTPLPAPFQVPGKKWQSYQAVASYSKGDDYGASGKIEAALPGVDLTSITAFRWNRNRFSGDIGAVNVPVVGALTDFQRRNFYQEVRAVSNGSGRLHWLAGATYFRDHINNRLGSLLFGFALPPTVAISRTKSWTVYGQAGYDITDRITLEGSLRYVKETKTAFFPADPVGFQSAKSNVNKLIPSATISYKLDDGTIYARYAAGFKTGGPNVTISNYSFVSLGLPSNILEPETVDSFEVGYRAQLFDHQVQFTSAVFYNSFSNLQLTKTGRPELPGVLVNAQKARTYGAEASLTWRVAAPLTVAANVGYLNAKYTKYSAPANPVTGVAAFDNSGNRMVLAPKWQLSAAVNLDQPIGGDLRLAGNLLYSYMSSHNFSAEAFPELQQKGYSIVNGRIGVVTADDKLGLYVFAKNLFNKYYAAYGAEADSIGRWGLPGDPRVIGGTLEMKF